MLKVKYSQKEQWVELEVSGEIALAQVRHACKNLPGVLQKMDHGYTLIEHFRNRPSFPQESIWAVGPLIGLCYEQSRIWRVVRVLSPNAPDPGLVVAHRVRWGRRVPEIEVDTLGEATALAREELCEQTQWLCENVLTKQKG
jgi:hypothetical protein